MIPNNTNTKVSNTKEINKIYVLKTKAYSPYFSIISIQRNIGEAETKLQLQIAGNA